MSHRLRLPRGAVAVALVAALLAGCGGSSHHTASTSAPTATGPAVSKSTYQATAVGVLHPLLDSINAALRSPRQPAVWQELQRRASDAYQTIGKLSPPPAIADLDHKLVRHLGTVASTAGGLFNALSSYDLSSAASLGRRLVSQGEQITSLGAQLKARGYTQVGSILAGP